MLAPLALAPPGRAQAPPVFSASIESVYVDVFVSKAGQPIPGLRAANFELKDNGVAQSPELVAAESLPLRTYLVFDTSSSLIGERLAGLKAAGEAFLSGLRPSDEASLLSFSEEISWLAPPTADKATVRKALARLQPAGATSAYDALYAALALAGDTGRALIVLFTDGEDNMSVLDEKQIVRAVERSNALVHTVGWIDPIVVQSIQVGRVGRITSSAPPEPDHIRALRLIAEATGGRFWGTDSPERLRRAFAEIADAMGQRYVLRYEARGVKRDGWHRIEIKLREVKGDIQARRGYWVAPRPRPAGGPRS
jgi:VWFA-related protein